MNNAKYYAQIGGLFLLFAVTFPPYILGLAAYRIIQRPVEGIVRYIAFSRAA